MLTLYSWAPFLVPVLMLWVVCLVNQNEEITEELDNWDNGLTWKEDRGTLSSSESSN